MNNKTTFGAETCGPLVLFILVARFLDNFRKKHAFNNFS